MVPASGAAAILAKSMPVPRSLCHVSYSQYCGAWGPIKGGHMILQRKCILGLTRVLVWDPCRLAYHKY